MSGVSSVPRLKFVMTTGRFDLGGVESLRLPSQEGGSFRKGGAILAFQSASH